MEQVFFEAGKALMELRYRKLYHSTHKTFEEYCRVRPWRWRSHRFVHNRCQSLTTEVVKFIVHKKILNFPIN
ncbi:hypothetical protein [Nostoc flagelliforme]|uniref:hypothetical protein n=1 Tax=Nostoc flagelliforme TaxID=1306274 RepID=UPI003BB00720